MVCIIRKKLGYVEIELSLIQLNATFQPLSNQPKHSSLPQGHSTLTHIQTSHLLYLYKFLRAINCAAFVVNVKTKFLFISACVILQNQAGDP